MRLLVRSVVLGSFLFSASQAFSLEPAFQIQQGVLSHKSMTTKDKPKVGATTTDKSTEMATMGNSLRISATTENMAFYVYPTDSSVPFGVGYYVMPELEVGLNISLNSTDNDNEDNTTDSDSTTNSYGPYLKYYLNNLGPANVELDFGINMGTEKASTNSVDTSDATSMEIFFAATAFMPIAKNLHYGVGLGYSTTTTEKKITGAESDVTETSLNLNLATLRFNF
ncbi:MAG: hypothetical protein KBD78_00140 [Oligoflexales bacterium]|nr:hypothetical protein [Oligoflexales bacterium]